MLVHWSFLIISGEGEVFWANVQGKCNADHSPSLSPDNDAGALVSMEPLHLHHPWLKRLPLLLREVSAYANHFESFDNNDDIDHHT